MRYDHCAHNSAICIAAVIFWLGQSVLSLGDGGTICFGASVTPENA